MGHRYGWNWVESQVADTIAIWNSCAGCGELDGRRFTVEEQQQREQAYDQALHEVERQLRRARPTPAARARAQRNMIRAFACFSARALDLEDSAVGLLTHDFLPVGTQLATWARRFDAELSMPGIIQACRNAWTAGGLQPLLGARIQLTPAILAYSLLYPYSDNYLDSEELSPEAKLRFSRNFRRRLRGETPAACNRSEVAIWTLVSLIEGQYPRHDYPDVFDCLLAIHRAQEQSISQQTAGSDDSVAELLPLSCAKGGTSVLADACLVHGRLSEAASRFAFQWGVLLQLGDDLQDIHEDLLRGSVTLFSQAAMRSERLDELVFQLLRFSGRVADQMDHLPAGDVTLKNLLRMSWRSLILMAIAYSHEFFTPQFLSEAECCSPFRFGFLRERRDLLAGRRGLYAKLFDAFLEPVGNDEAVPLPMPASIAFPSSVAFSEVSPL